MSCTLQSYKVQEFCLQTGGTKAFAHLHAQPPPAHVPRPRDALQLPKIGHWLDLQAFQLLLPQTETGASLSGLAAGEWQPSSERVHRCWHVAS